MKKKKLITGRKIEKSYPQLFAVVFATLSIILIIKLNRDIINDDILDKVIDAIINFTSILIGFVGVLIGILFSIRDEKVVERLFKSSAKEDLKKYFISAFFSGILLIIISIVMYLRAGIYFKMINIGLNVTISTIFVGCIFTFWVACIGYTLGCSYRIIDIMLTILFNNEFNDVKQSDSIESNIKNELHDIYKQ